MSEFQTRRKNIEKKKSSFLSKILKLLLLVIIIASVFLYATYSNFREEILIPNDLVVHIEATDTFATLGTIIPELDNIGYKIYLKNNPPSYTLNEGNYKIKGGSNIEGIFAGLEKPISEEIMITILEGWNIYDIDKCLSDPEYFAYTRDNVEYTCMFKYDAGEKVYVKEKLINEGEFIDYVTNQEKIDALSEFYPFIDGQITFEGFLYPDTYNINVGDFKINTFVIKQLDTFESKVYNTLLANYDVSTISDIVTLASIVEKEERNNDEKPTVAGILKKRLNSDWMIGADVTVCYPHKLTSRECQNLIPEYIGEVSEYNTRTMLGLPKTPIGNPSYDTIYATINDNETDYWYYLHNVSSGKIYYGRTNAEHEANKAYMY